MNIKSLIHKLITEEVAAILEQQGGFKFHIFKKLETGKEMVRYAEKYLPELGFGSSRNTFAWKAGKVLKIARGHTIQNEIEIETLTNPDFMDVLPKLIDYDKENYLWLVVEAVKTLDKNISLKSQLGLTSSRDFMLSFQGMVDDYYKDGTPIEEIINLTIEEVNDYNKKYGNPLSIDKITKLDLELLRLIAKYLSMGMHDICRIDHWGTTIDGRLVIVDAGLAR